MISRIWSKIGLIGLGFALVYPGAAISQEKIRLNLEECVQRALRYNADIRMAHHDWEGYVARKIEATKRYVPVVKYRYQLGPAPRDLDSPLNSIFNGEISVFNSIKVEAGIPVTTFGELKWQRHLADIGINSYQLFKQRKADEVVLDIHKLYNGVLLAREARVLGDKGMDALHKKIEELEKKETTDQLGILKLQAIIYELDRRLEEANTKEVVALEALKWRVGLRQEVDFDIKSKSLRRYSFSHRSYESLLDQSRRNRPGFRLLDYQVQEKDARLEIAKKAYWPRLTLGAGIEYGVAPGIRGDEGDNAFNNPLNFTRGAIGFELQGELDFRKIKAGVELAKAERLKALADKETRGRQLEIDLKQTYFEYKQAKRRLAKVEKHKKSARQVVFLTKSNVDIGLGKKEDYLDALQSYLLIQAAAFEDLYKYNVAVASLKAKLGQLYDPKRLKWE